MHDVPEPLLTGPFTRRQALELGATKKMLAGARFVRVHPRVWRHRDYEMSWADEVRAAQLALPAQARLTHVTRIQQLGISFGPRRPLHFVVEGELHLALEGIFLHRTKALAPGDDMAVLPAAAFIAYCSTARLLDAVVVGDWLLYGKHMTVRELTTLALVAPWRDGADEALFVIDWLDHRSRSVKESETRAILVASGLPSPEPNHSVDLGDDARAFGDLVSMCSRSWSWSSRVRTTRRIDPSTSPTSNGSRSSGPTTSRTSRSRARHWIVLEPWSVPSIASS